MGKNCLGSPDSGRQGNHHWSYIFNEVFYVFFCPGCGEGDGAKMVVIVSQEPWTA